MRLRIPRRFRRAREELVDLLEPFPGLTLARGDLTTYGRFRSLEPNLVSLLDGKEPGPASIADVLVLRARQHPMGAVSFMVQANEQRRGDRSRYARIDLVIVGNDYRGIGVGRSLLLCVNTYLLGSFGDSLYSISCLAAHPAVKQVLEELSFQGQSRPHLSYTHEELSLEGLELQSLISKFAEKTTSALRVVNYNLRQRCGNS